MPHVEDSQVVGWGFDAAVSPRGIDKEGTLGRLTPAQREMYEQFNRTFVFCWACGWCGQYRSWMLNRLVNAHIIGASGRRADRRDISRLCDGCHLLNHNNRIVLGGQVLPSLSLPNLLWLKAHFDPDHYDPEYLMSLRIKRAEPLIPEPLPDWFNSQRESSSIYKNWLARRS